MKKRIRAIGARAYEETLAPGHPSGVRRRRLSVCWIERPDGGRQCAQRTGDRNRPFLFVRNRICESVGWTAAGRCPTRSGKGAAERRFVDPFGL